MKVNKRIEVLQSLNNLKVGDIVGLAKENSRRVVKVLSLWKEYEGPKEEDCSEWIYCLDYLTTDKLDANERDHFLFPSEKFQEFAFILNEDNIDSFLNESEDDIDEKKKLGILLNAIKDFLMSQAPDK